MSRRPSLKPSTSSIHHFSFFFEKTTTNNKQQTTTPFNSHIYIEDINIAEAFFKLFLYLLLVKKDPSIEKYPDIMRLLTRQELQKSLRYCTTKYPHSTAMRTTTRSIISTCQGHSHASTDVKVKPLSSSKSKSISCTEQRSPSKNQFLTTASFSTSTAESPSSPSLQERGILNQNNLLNFDTLHELQMNASIAFADNPLFGTYTERKEGEGDKADASFEWMTYSEYGEKVDACRTVLKDLGMFFTVVCFEFSI